MPTHTYPTTPAGLAVPVLVGVSGTLAASLLRAGAAVPAPVQARGLLDTGSNATALASSILRALPISSVRRASSQTASGLIEADLFEVSLSILNGDMLTIPSLIVSELATVLPDADVLIGLDVILTCKLLVDGPARQFTLEFTA